MTKIDINPGWATYLRVSDEDKQTPERSFAMQRQRIEEHLLKTTPIPFHREYTDLLSGTKANRKDYQQMLADARAGKFSHLGLYRADRFGRNTVEGLQAATQLIGLGIKIRIANMPSLQPESPDGFFMFLIQMGMAQREVDVLAQRTVGGMEAKMRAGGWPHKAPQGYVNKERQVGSNKYERWVEQDPDDIKAIKLAWELLLTDRYTLTQICEELSAQGFTKASGLPWAWNDKPNGIRKTAHNSLHTIFYNPFYAGWATSKKFGIKIGEVRGNWEPIITTDQYEKGKSILKKHGFNKANFKKRHYLLRGILYVTDGQKSLKMYGSTPSGRSASFSYYRTHGLMDGKKIRIRTETVDTKIPGFLKGIAVDPEMVPEVRKMYQEEIRSKTLGDKEGKLKNLKEKLNSLTNEESRLARLFMTEKINEETYDRLREEWLEKTRNIKAMIKELEMDASQFLDDLELALSMMSKLSTIFHRLEEKKRTALLQVLVKRIMINPVGEIVDYELHLPFMYLSTLASRLNGSGHKEDGSTIVLFGTPTATRTQNLRIRSPLLYPLSYGGKFAEFIISFRGSFVNSCYSIIGRRPLYTLLPESSLRMGPGSRSNNSPISLTLNGALPFLRNRRKIDSTRDPPLETKPSCLEN